MAQHAVSFPDLGLDKFSGNDPDQDVKSFLLTVENKTIHLDHTQTMLAKLLDISSERKHFSLLHGPAAEWY